MKPAETPNEQPIYVDKRVGCTRRVLEISILANRAACKAYMCACVSPSHVASCVVSYITWSVASCVASCVVSRVSSCVASCVSSRVASCSHRVPRVSPGVLFRVSPHVFIMSPHMSPGVLLRVSPGVLPTVSPVMSPRMSPRASSHVSSRMSPRVLPRALPRVSPHVSSRVPSRMSPVCRLGYRMLASPRPRRPAPKSLEAVAAAAQVALVQV